MSFAGFYGKTDRDESMATLARAAELGVTHLDTAIVYGAGLSESIIGEYTANHDHPFVIGSKCGIEATPEGRRINNSRNYIRAALEGSLERLQSDRIDLYYLHRYDPNTPIETSMESMAELVAEGLIGGIGLSEIAPATLERASRVHPVAAVQSEYSLWSRLPDLGMIDACRRLGTTFVAFSPVARGAFSDVPLDPAQFAKHDFRSANPRFSAENWPANNERIDRLRSYAGSRGWNTSALAVAWTLARGEHIVPIPGTRSADHLDQLATATEITLGPDDMAELEELLPVGFAHGNRYSWQQIGSTELYC